MSEDPKIRHGLPHSCEAGSSLSDVTDLGIWNLDSGIQNDSDG